MLARKRSARELREHDRALRAQWLPPAPVEVDAEALERARMRRWWLDRFTLDEIREMGAGLL